MNEDYKLVKAFCDDDSYCIRFDFGDDCLYNHSDKEGAIYKSDYKDIKPLEETDTLQEVVEWSWDEECKIIIDFHNVTFYYRNGDRIEMPFDMVLEHIRKPKHTNQEQQVLDLAKKLGVEIELKK